LGQNFLTNPHIVDKIIDAADLLGDELVVEVGPGFGILTEALIKKAGRVIAIEKDTRLIMQLKLRFLDKKNFELINADALKVPPPKEPFLFIANIPYSITSPLLDHFIRDNTQNLPRRAVLLVQKEVALKICAAPPDMNVLALHVQTFGKPSIVCHVSRNNFKPKPKVDSAIIKIDFDLSLRASAKQSGPVSSQPDCFAPTVARNDKSFDLTEYFKLIHQAFAHKRKMLRGTLPVELLNKAKIDPTRRPETLTIEEWILMAKLK